MTAVQRAIGAFALGAIVLFFVYLAGASLGWATAAGAAVMLAAVAKRSRAT